MGTGWWSGKKLVGGEYEIKTKLKIYILSSWSSEKRAKTYFSVLLFPKTSIVCVRLVGGVFLVFIFCFTV